MAASVSNRKQQRVSGKPPAPVVHPFQFQGDDHTLVRGMRDGHPGAFRAFYRRYVSSVYAVLLRTLGSDDELDILIQEVFAKAFQGIHSLKNADQAKSWLSSIAVNTARDTIKQRKRSRWLRFFEPAKMPEPELEPADSSDGNADREAVATVYRLLDQLSVDHRIAFTLRYMNEMELTEVAEACDVSLATIKRRLARAKRQLYALAKDQPVLQRWVQYD